ncbi:hypothetical protein HPB48_023768 [Haemaphysalis longicornis]|uniref:C2H2-type domain-containing protein n=1 Tax=Haemaphysalis longicornis TaxID=44386 RepID=A0A9J6H5R3_HAELO|nr:hypothetical protein HPB48_023768 [Haemaphysalis longicornis]
MMSSLCQKFLGQRGVTEKRNTKRSNEVTPFCVAFCALVINSPSSQFFWQRLIRVYLLRDRSRPTYVSHVVGHTNRKSYSCEQCQKSFRRREYLDNHLKTHNSTERPLQCSDCGLSFSKRANLNRHLKSQHRAAAGDDEAKGNECATCGKHFARADSLARHAVVHTGERRFECTTCCKKFSYATSLREHEKNMHAAPVPPSPQEPDHVPPSDG